jgi:hypothetical protein
MGARDGRGLRDHERLPLGIIGHWYYGVSDSVSQSCDWKVTGGATKAG